MGSSERNACEVAGNPLCRGWIAGGLGSPSRFGVEPELKMVANARGLVVVQDWSMDAVRSAREAVAAHRRPGGETWRDALREAERRRAAVQPASASVVEAEDYERWDGLS